MVHCKLSSKSIHYAQEGRNARLRGVKKGTDGRDENASKWRGNSGKLNEER